MKKSIENEKEFLNRYGKIIDYYELQEDDIKEKPISGLRYRLVHLIKESEIGQFTTYINNQNGTIQLTSYRPYPHFLHHLSHSSCYC